MMTMLTLLALAQMEPQETPADKALDAANGLLQEKKYTEALAKYEECLKLEPDRLSALFNGGMAAFFADKAARAIELWERHHKLEPEDTGTLGKLVQACQKAGDLKKRDAYRKALSGVRDAMTQEERAKFPRFCRDQFKVKDVAVMTFEYFELKGERAVRYRFSVLNAKGDAEEYHLSLGSYEMTTKIAREAGTIGKDERMFHLDGYFDGGKRHRTYGMIKSEPSYDDARKLVEEVLKGDREAQSGTDK